MPNIADIVDAVDLLKIDPIAIDEERCVAVRNRNASCRRCLDACIADAITIKRNSIAVDPDLCMNCGACAAACPMSALSMVEPASEQIDAAVLNRTGLPAGMCIIACSRQASKGEGDPEKFAEAPCLAHLDERMLVSYIAQGRDDIVLVDGDCATCKLGAVDCAIDAAIDSAGSMAEAAGGSAVITRMHEFPLEALLEEDERYRGKSRRGLARQTSSYMRKVAGNAVRRTLEDKLGMAETEADKRRRRIARNGRLPRFVPYANYSIIDGMCLMAEEGDGGLDAVASNMFESRHFGEVMIDTDICNDCGMCVMFCPTDALKYSEYDDGVTQGRCIEFSASDCTQCRLCADVCLKHCIEVSPMTLLGDIVDPAPRSIHVRKPL